MNIRELHDARSLIESDVARRAAVAIGAEDLARLEAILAEQAGALADLIAFRASDFAFHQSIWIGCRNAFLKRNGQSLNMLGLEFRKRASETPGVLEQSFADHRRLLAELRSRDPQAAAGAAEVHMQNVFQSTIVRGDQT